MFKKMVCGPCAGVGAAHGAGWKIALLVLLVFGWGGRPTVLCHAQNGRTLGKDMRVLDLLLDRLAFLQGEELLAGEALTDWYESMAARPLDLNRATKAQLKELGFLTDYQVAVLLDYRREYGVFYSYKEIDLIPGFTPELRVLLEAFTWLDPLAREFSDSLDWKARLLRGKHTLIMRMKAAFPVTKAEKTYAGPLFNRCMRYRYAGPTDQWGGGFCLESDVGEKRWADHVAGHIRWRGAAGKNKNFSAKRVGLENLILGDYQVRWGQGLAVWNGFGFTGRWSPASMYRYAAGISGYQGAGEALFFRGVAVSIRLGDYGRVQVFGSWRKRDARMQSGEVLRFTSLPETGYHRTPGEMETRRTLNAYTAGMRMELGNRFAKVGLNLMGYHYGAQDGRRVRPYNALIHRKTPFGAISLDWHLQWRRWHAYGEAACDGAGHLAVTAGVFRQSRDAFAWGMQFHGYGRAYTSPYAHAPGARQEANNERSLSLAATWNVAMHWTLSGRLLAAWFPHPRYRCEVASPGAEAVLRLEHKRQYGGGYLQVKWKEDALNFTSPVTGGKYVIIRHRLQLRQHIRIPIGSRLMAETRAEEVGVHPSLGHNQWGLMLYEEVKFGSSRDLWQVSARLAGYKTSGYVSRIYAFESQVLYGFSLPALYGTGLRAYVNVRCSPLKSWDFWLRWAYGPRHEITVQVRWCGALSGRERRRSSY